MRVPPNYPEYCMDTASSRESVFVEFDVTPDGATTNVKVIDTTNSCLNRASVRTVEKWTYHPKIEGGVAVERKGVQTALTFELSDGSAADRGFRLNVAKRLNRVGGDLRRGKDATEALAELQEIEDQYGAGFTKSELTAFHQLRGSARLKAGDYRGALDDLRMARKGALSVEASVAISDTIEKLEAYVAAEDAGALAPPEESPSAEVAPPPEQ